MLPLHLLVFKIVRDNPREAHLSEVSYLPTLRLFLRLYPEAAGMKDADKGETPYGVAKRKGGSPLLRRLLLQASPQQDLDEYHRLNWEERKMAMFLGLKAVSAKEPMILAKLRFQNKDLLRRVVSFL
jgi:hypothetical protein